MSSQVGKVSFSRQVPKVLSASPNSELLLTDDGPVTDLLCGTSCVGLGFATQLQAAIFARAMEVPLNTYDANTIWRDEAEAALRSVLPGYQFAFFSGGAEAVEAAIRIGMDL